jgi:hypothetical protein
MAKDLRSQLKPTKITQLKKTVDSDNTIIGAVTNEYLSLEDGKAIKIRLFPAHPGEERFYIPKKCYWLTRINDEGDPKRFTVLDAVVHGGAKMDLVEQYAKMAKKKNLKNQKIIEAITGDKDSLNPSYSWVAYGAKVVADEDLAPKLWEFKKMVRDGLNKLAFSEDEDEVIEIDPFTDPDDGIPVLVKYNKKPNRKAGENYYEVSFPKNAKARPLSDEEIEVFMALKPLTEAIGSYSIKEFERALEGIQNFDEEHEIGLFEDDEWIELVEEIKAQFDGDDDDEKPAKKKVAKKKVVEEDDEDEEEDEPKKPAKKPAKKAVEDDDDEEEEKPAKKSSKKVVEDDEDDEDDEPKKPSKKKPVEDDEDEDDEDDVPAKKPKLSMADIKKKMGKK